MVVQVKLLDSGLDFNLRVSTLIQSECSDDRTLGLDLPHLSSILCVYYRNTLVEYDATVLDFPKGLKNTFLLARHGLLHLLKLGF